MKKIRNVAIFFFFACSLLNYVYSDAEVQTKIDSVTIYQPSFAVGNEITGSAVVKRIASFSLNSIYRSDKPVELEVILPEKLDLISINTLRVSVDSGGKLLSVHYEIVKTTKGNIKELQDKLHELEDKYSAISEYIGAIKQQESLIRTIRLSSDNFIPSSDEIASILDLVEGKLKSMADTKVALVRKQKDLLEEIEDLKRKMSDLNSIDKRRYKVLISILPEDKSKEIVFSMSYLVNGVSWRPQYKVVFDGKTGVSVEMIARVSQHTGTDWEGVELTLSSGKTYKLSYLPPVRSMKVVFKENICNRKQRMLLKSVSAVAESISSPDKSDSIDSWSDVSEKRRVFDIVEYKLKGRFSIPSGGKEGFVRIEKWNMDAKEFYYAVLQDAERVYWVIELKKDTRFISGMDVSIFVGNTLVNKSRINLNKPWYKKDRWLLTLGEAEFVGVKKVELKNKKNELLFGTISSPTITQSYSYKISIENRGDREVLIRLVDAIPTSTTDKIKVKDIKLVPSPVIKELLGKKDVYLWEFTLPPHSNKEISESFAICYPSKKEIKVLPGE